MGLGQSTQVPGPEHMIWCVPRIWFVTTKAGYECKFGTTKFGFSNPNHKICDFVTFPLGASGNPKSQITNHKYGCCALRHVFFIMVKKPIFWSEDFKKKDHVDFVLCPLWRHVRVEHMWQQNGLKQYVKSNCICVLYISEVNEWYIYSIMTEPY